MELKRRIIRNVLSNWTGYAVVIGVTFFLSPFVVHALGDSGYGVWVLVGSLTGYFGLLDLGIRPAIVKFAAQYQALDNARKINEVVNTSLVVSSVLGLITALATMVLAYFSPQLFKVAPEYLDDLRIVVMLVGVKVAIDFPFAVFGALFNAFQRFDLNNLIGISFFLMRSLLIVVFLKLGGGIIELGMIMLIGGVAEALVRLFACYHIFPALKISFSLANRETLKMLYSFSLFIFLIGLASQITFYSSSIIIGAFLSASAITYYAIGANLIEYLKNLVAQMTMTITPVASAFDAHNDNERLTKLLLIGTRYCLLVILPIGYVYLVMGQTFISLWMGPSYGPSSSRVLAILTVSCFGFLSQLVSGSILYGLGKIKTLAVANLTSAAVIIALTLALVKPYHIYGVALGTAIPQTIYGTIFLPLYICQVLGLKPWQYLRKSFLPPLVASLPFLVLVLLIEYTVAIDSLAVLGLAVAGAFVAYAVCVFFIGLDTFHREALWGKTRARLHDGLRRAAK